MVVVWRRLAWAFVVGCVSLLVSAGGESAEFRLEPDLPYLAERTRPVTYDVELAIVVTAPYQTEHLRVWLPLPPSDGGQEISRRQLETFPQVVPAEVHREPVYGNQFAYFDFVRPQGAQVIRHRFRATIWELRWQLDPSRLSPEETWPSSFDPYRRSDTQAVKIDERFERLLAEIIPRRSTPWRDFTQVMSWVNQNFTYDHEQASLRADAEHGLMQRRGHCSDYHSFCASLGRMLGQPTRVTYGLNTFPKNSPSHCKMEVFLAPYGWVSFDVSETQKLQRAIQTADLSPPEKERLVRAAQARLEGGFRDATWLLQTRGTDYELAPKASRRVPVVRTAWIEADGVPLPDPDPASSEQRQFAWMTVTDFKADRPVPYAFADWKTLDGT